MFFAPIIISFDATIIVLFLQLIALSWRTLNSCEVQYSCDAKFFSIFDCKISFLFFLFVLHIDRTFVI